MSLDPAKREHGEEPIVIHRGTLQEMREEYKNRKIHAKPEPKAKPVPVQKIEQHPVKGIIKDFEKDNKQIEEEKNNINMKSTEDDGEKIPSIIPPKPLPRTSRTSSMCDSQPAEDANSAPKPVARPRTNSCVPVVTSVSPVAPVSGGYKVINVVFDV
ncbi:unnamed protein product [Diabrotica balteata]|uniref:Uncharacterized protein n=1 Tax=Diabrotica balteata TaxID=107213 RepID=A0A9N9X7J7_DIABA|nr:unnamed protein product [Diabrotica balteata]